MNEFDTSLNFKYPTSKINKYMYIYIYIYNDMKTILLFLFSFIVVVVKNCEAF